MLLVGQPIVAAAAFQAALAGLWQATLDPESRRAAKHRQQSRPNVGIRHFHYLFH
jgi:hypothetical protein